MRLFAVSAFSLCALLPSVAAAASGYTLLFEFKPAFVQASGTAPAFFLDNCGDQYCSAAPASVPMNCDAVGEAAAPGASPAFAVTRCRVSWKMKHGRRAQAPVAWLTSAGYLRVRNGDQASAPFYFAGLPPGADEIDYRYRVSAQGPGGALQVVPLQ